MKLHRPIELRIQTAKKLKRICLKFLLILLNSVEMKNQLPKTILYSLNPNDNYVIASMINSFQDGITPGKIQFGTAKLLIMLAMT